MVRILADRLRLIVSFLFVSVSLLCERKPATIQRLNRLLLLSRSRLIVVFFSFSIIMISGCNSLASRFMARAIEQAGEPIRPVEQIVASPIRASVGLSILWAGHATVLIQIHDKVIITDPVFTRTVGILAKRSVAPGLDPSSLTRLDAILISHIHFDHFSY
ncbi:MAG: uncharacterized protein HW389_3690, partial [Bacteroidetes bacterium]|nr:uncharacterized protein [Bacteroidota bacterium]